MVRREGNIMKVVRNGEVKSGEGRGTIGGDQKSCVGDVNIYL